jgi:hypothetical protein
MKINILEKLGIIVSFPKSLIPSEIGCNKPYIPIKLGPLLRCIPPNTFLSKSVRKAIDNNSGIKKEIYFNHNILIMYI